MGIKFVPTAKTLRLLDVRSFQKTAEDGTVKTFNFAKFVDESTFESNEFMLPREIDPSSLVVQNRYEVTLDVDGKWTRLSLTPAADSAPALGFGSAPATSAKK